MSNCVRTRMLASLVAGCGVASASLLSVITTEVNGASFNGLGDLPGGYTESMAMGISADGNVVVGRAESVHGTEAFRWTQATGMEGLGDLGGADFISIANGASADGSVIVGTGRCNIGDEPFRWTRATGMVGLGDFPGTACPSCQRRGAAVSADGSVVVGTGTGLFNFEAFRWTEATGMVRLGTVDGAVQSFAEGISADGSVVIGRTNNQAFRWTATTGMVGLGDLGGTFEYPVSEAFGISANGKVIVGGARNTSDRDEAFRWTEAGMEGLGILPGWPFNAASDASADGSVVVGLPNIFSGGEAFIWDGAHGLRGLRTVLESDYQLDLTGWHLIAATAISDDGRTIVGYGTNPVGQTEAWIARLDVTAHAVARVIAVADVNVNGRPDVAVLRAGPLAVEVRDGMDGALLRTLVFLDGGFAPVALAALPDTDGNGTTEIAVLARRRSDGRGVVEIRNLTGVQAVRQVWFAAGHRPVALAVITGDADDNGVPELAVLSTRNSDGRGLVEVKNAFGATKPASIWAGAGLTPSDLEIVEDADQNGVPEVAVLSTRNSDGRIVVEVKNAVGPTNPTSVWFMAGNTAIDLAVVPDKDGNTVPEVAVLSSRDSDGRIVVEVKNAAGATSPTRGVVRGRDTAGLAVEAVADADGNAVPELAVLSSRNSDGRVLVEVKNAAGATNPRSLWYPAGYAARDLAVLPDVDGNGIEEAAVLMLRDSDGRIVVQRRNAAGPQAPVDYWFSP